MSKEIFIKSLAKIGTKLSDFEEVPNEKKHLKYFILGKGNFGYAEKMKSKKNNLYYAIKKLDIYKIENIKNFHRETEIMFSLNHENIIKFYGYFEDKENIAKYKEIYRDKENIEKGNYDRKIYCLVLEYAPNGSLNDYLIRNREYSKIKGIYKPIEESFIIKIFKQLLNAFIYLFSKSIMHRDIKPDNILFDINNNVKITDFGLSALYRDENPENINKPNYLFGDSSRVGRYDFISPEIEKGIKYDFESDIFSLGLTMLCLISKENPIKMYVHKVSHKQVRKIDIKVINPNYNNLLKDLILSMIKDDPKARPTVKEAFNKLIQIENYCKNNNQNYTKFNSDKNIHRNYTYQNFSNISNMMNLQSKNPSQISQNTNNFPYQRMQSDKIQNYNKNLNYPETPTDFMSKKYQSDEISFISDLSSNNSQYKIFKNTSLIRILQFLCRCIKENLKSIIESYIKNSLSLDLFNILEITKSKIANAIDTEKFSQSITNFRISMSSKSALFKGEEEINPKFIFDELFKVVKEDFIINNLNIIWNSDFLNEVVESQFLPKIYFPHIYEKIEKIKNENKNPFFDIFYYISIELTVCPRCNLTIQTNAHSFYFIPLPAKFKDKISNLIINYFNNPKKVELKCNKCLNNAMTSYKFYSTPKYLLIFFEGNEKKEKLLDECIDLSPFCYTNIGPKKYFLYGFIRKSNNNEYKSIIKNENENNWIYFSGIDDIAKGGFSYNQCYFPIIAVYKGLD